MENVGFAAYNEGSVRFVSRETAGPCDFLAGYRLNGVQARSQLGKVGGAGEPNGAIGLALSLSQSNAMPHFPPVPQFARRQR
jgi:hypothetical protein